MIKISTSALLVLCSAAALSAQHQRPQDAWQDFLTANGPGWTASWNAATNTPSAVYGTGLRVAPRVDDIAAAREHAAAVLDKYAALLGRGESKFVEVSSARIRHLFYLVYKQEYKGLEVIGGRADVRINSGGVVAMFGSMAVPIPTGFDTRPVINAAAATAVAHGNVLGKAGKQVAQAPRLVVWADATNERPTTPVLAWEVTIDESPELKIGRAYMDASGAGKGMLQFVDDVHYCATCRKHHVTRPPADPAAARLQHGMDKVAALAPATPGAGKPEAGAAPMPPLTGTVMGWVNLGHTPLDPLQNVPLANLQVTSAAGNAFTDANGNFSIPYTGNTPVVVSATLVGRHSTQVQAQTGARLTASATITPGTPGTLQFGTQNMGEDGHSQTTTYHYVNDVNEWVRTLVPNRPAEMNRLDGINPIVNSPQSCNAFFSPTAFTITFFNSSATCNMTAFRAVIYHEWGHGLDHVFGGINTTHGLSEGWADVVAIVRAQYPILGEKFYKSRTPDYVRTALNTKTFPATGGTHAQGEVWMGWVWDLRTDLVARFGTQLGQQFTEQIVIPTIVANATTLPNQILEVFLLDDNDGNLKNGTPNYVSLEKASLKRTIPFPKLDVGTVKVTQLGTTQHQLTPRLVRADLVTITGNFTKIELVYDAGAGVQRREMVPTGKPNEYVALLPGILSPNEVAYHVEATHATSKVIRDPESGEISYAVGNENVFFTDDFETNKPGWSTGTLFGNNNDFSRGTPSGRSGTSWNVQWSDPNGAFSGANAWGNNLGGAYTQTQAAYLRTPTLDLTGRRNVRMRFMRWLQVQDNGFDQARIAVNGNEVWANPFGSHLIDRAWTRSDVRLNGADNNSAVNVEWQLVSDAGLELGGWNIDDVTIYSFDALPAPKFTYVVDPPQVDLGKNSAATLKGTPNAPVLLLFSPSEGPINIPGLPTLYIGSAFVPIAAALDNNGDLKVNFTAPTSTSATGQVTYTQALELTNATTLTASNPSVVLWGK